LSWSDNLQWVSEWLLFNANSEIFQLYHGENKLIFNEIMMRSAFFQTNMLSWIFIVLAHWNNSPRIDMSPLSDTDPDFEPTKSLLFIPSPTKLRRDIVTLTSVRPSFRNILVNTLESTSFNGFWPNLVHT
jgi:hypothetical protein